MSKIIELEKEVARLQASLDAKQETIDILKEVMLADANHIELLQPVPSVNPDASPWLHPDTITNPTWICDTVPQTTWTSGTVQGTSSPAVYGPNTSTQYFVNKPSGIENTVADKMRPRWSADSQAALETAHGV